MRQQRNNEAKALIGSRVGTAKAMFTQHSASGQMHGSANAAAAAANRAAAPAKPARNSIAQRINSFNNATVATATATSATTTTKPAPASEMADVVKSHIPAPVPEEAEDNVEEKHYDEEKTNASKAAAVDAVESPENHSNGHATQSIAADEPIHHSSAVADVQPTEVPAVAAVTTAYEEDTVVGDQYSTIKRSPYTKQNSTASGNSQVATPVDPEPPTSIPEVQVQVQPKATSALTINALSASDASRGVVIKDGRGA